MITTDLLQLAMDIEARGLKGREADVRQVVRAARVAGISRVSVDVLADDAQPEVARLRAFGTIAAALDRLRRRPAVDHAA
ncbi:MAG: hypothetical protein H0U21_17145 [Acidimicrobiia bacterium]|nr:hypothetical protein [Acidimicrobiia bacterium]